MKLAKSAPIIAIVGFMVAGEVTRFEPGTMRIVALASLAVTLVALRAHGGIMDSSPVHKTMAAFLSLEAVLYWFFSDGLGRMLDMHAVALLYLCLFLMAALPLLLGRPSFTTFFARQDTPKEFWGTDIFININRNMGFVWAGLFVVCGISALISNIYPGLNSAPMGLLFRLVIPLGIVVGIGRAFNSRYPAYYQAKMGVVPDGE